MKNSDKLPIKQFVTGDYALEVDEFVTFDRLFNGLASFQMAAKRFEPDRKYTMTQNKKRKQTIILRIK